MEFLEKLYSNENFGLILVILIIALIILFFIVLFFGKKSSKKSVNEEIKQPENINNMNNELLNQTASTPLVANSPQQAFKETSEDQKVEVIPMMNEPEPLKTMPSAPVDIAENIPTVENSLLNEEPKEPDNLTETVDIDKEFDFNALAEAINKELESIKEPNKEVAPEENIVKEEPKPVIEEKPFAFPNFEQIKPDAIPEEMVPSKKEEEQVKPRTAMPTVFSSVYVNRNNEEKKAEQPVKPKIELPKRVDLPKRADVLPKEEAKETFTINSVLDNAEETYEIKK